MRKDAREARAKIVNAARNLMLKEGPMVSFRSIATAAGVGVATVHRHFPEQLELFKEVIPEIIADVQQVITKREDLWSTDPRRAWRETIHEVSALENVLLDPAFFARAAEDPKAVDLQGLAVQPVVNLWTDILARAAQAGLVNSELSPTRFHLGLVAISRRWPERVVNFDPGLRIWLVDLFLDGLETEADQS